MQKNEHDRKTERACVSQVCTAILLREMRIKLQNLRRGQ